jgi:hypothetical protein
MADELAVLIVTDVTGTDPRKIGGKGGNRTLDPGIMSAVL